MDAPDSVEATNPDIAAVPQESSEEPRRPNWPLVGVVLVVLAVVTAVGVPNLLNAIQRGKQKRTMGDMRTFATAMESYSIDNMQYVRMDANDLADLDRLAKYLEPTYIKKLPRQDGWSEPFQVRAARAEYTIMSYGKDRRPDGPDVPRPGANGGTTDFRSDIIFSTGSFVQFPDGGIYPNERPRRL
jgi:general secretion pathway protein G